MLSFKQEKSVSLEIATKGNANQRISKQKGSVEYGVLLKIVLPKCYPNWTAVSKTKAGQVSVTSAI